MAKERYQPLPRWRGPGRGSARASGPSCWPDSYSSCWARVHSAAAKVATSRSGHPHSFDFAQPIARLAAPDRRRRYAARSRLHVFKTGTAEVGTDPMPANISDPFVILKPRINGPMMWTARNRIERQKPAQPWSAAPSRSANPSNCGSTNWIAGVRGDTRSNSMVTIWRNERARAKVARSSKRSRRGGCQVEQTEGFRSSRQPDRDAIALR